MITTNFFLTAARILVFVISAGFLFDRSKKYFLKKDRQTFIKYATTLVVWMSILLSTFYTPFFNESDTGSLLLFYMLILAFVLIFKLLNMIERAEDKIAQIVKYDAIMDFKSKKNKNAKNK